jgi:hypothetical protein
MVFVTIVGSNYFTKEEREGNTTWGHWRNTNLFSQMFLQVERGM